MTELDYNILEKQVKARKAREFMYTVFLNPGFAFLLIAMAIFAYITNDAQTLEMNTRLIVVIVSGWGLFITGGIWVAYIRMQEIGFELNRLSEKQA